MESGWNLCVWLVGMVSRRWVWLVGGIYGCGYREWVWLEYIGVVVGGVVRRYKDFLILLIPTPLVFALFTTAFLLLCSF